ncbi:MAG: flagellar basal body rod protein FlgC, partial [Akkermansiaceae bacterium]|nr:flagellar basal body rod protein FlgC [Verrucomicrobiales bacterium]
MINILSGIQSTSAALSAERTRMDVISENIANAHTTRGVDGKAYQRKLVVFETALQQAVNGGTPTSMLSGTRIQKDERPAQLIYQPGHPDADANGMV